MSNSISSINSSLFAQFTIPQYEASRAEAAATSETKAGPAYLPEDTVKISAAAKSS